MFKIHQTCTFEKMVANLNILSAHNKSAKNEWGRGENNQDGWDMFLGAEYRS